MVILPNHVRSVLKNVGVRSTKTMSISLQHGKKTLKLKEKFVFEFVGSGEHGCDKPGAHRCMGDKRYRSKNDHLL
jgi:hypothetical protein